MRALAALLLLCGAARAEVVELPAAGFTLRAEYAAPARLAGAGVVALHGCGGPWARRDQQWRGVLVGDGHAVLFPDSFGSRGLGPQCKVRDRAVHPGRDRVGDARVAAEYLAARPGMPAGGVIVLGWSNGGTTVLEAAAEGAMPPGLVRGFVAFYPGCRTLLQRTGWAPSAPMLVVMGEADDWTPAAPCHALAARFPGRITLVTHPGAFHDFDVPGRPLRLRRGLGYTPGNSGEAHAGTDEPAREWALREVPAWIDRLAPVR